MSVRQLLTIGLVMLMTSTSVACADNLPADQNSKARPSNIQAGKPEIKVTMRDHGYTIGDVITMRVLVRLPAGQVIDANSIPLKGPVNAWLDLHDVILHELKQRQGKNEVLIDFTWQIFATVEHAQQIKIPAIQLQVLPVDLEKAGAKKPVWVTIPAQAFHLSPVLPPLLTETKPRPHIPPMRFDTYKPAAFATVFFALGMLCLGIWLWLADKIAWWPHNPGPMTKLARQLRKYTPSKLLNEADLRDIHAALNKAAGQTLYPYTLERLFQTSPYLIADHVEITQFFKQSWAVFFESSQSQSIQQPICVAETRAWVQRAALAERLYRANQRKLHASFGRESQLHHQSKA